MENDWLAGETLSPPKARSVHSCALMSGVLLAHKWADEDPTGWWVSEKLDGIRALWRRHEFVSRSDNRYACPDWFARKMPQDCVLDGELWGGRRQFQKVFGIVQSKAREADWEYLTFMAFDVLEDAGLQVTSRPFEERYAMLERICAGSDVLEAVPMRKCSSRDHLMALLDDVERRGGEGLMLRRHASIYEHRRSHSLLKVKSFYDEEALVVGHEMGRAGAWAAGLCASVVCQTPDGRQFEIGSGLSDAQRRNPPKVNAVVTYRYQEITAANKPRFATLVGERPDLDWRTLCRDYVPPRPRLEATLKKSHTLLFKDGNVTGGGLRRFLTREDVQQLAVSDDLEMLHNDFADALGLPPAKRVRLAEEAGDQATSAAASSSAPPASSAPKAPERPAPPPPRTPKGSSDVRIAALRTLLCGLVGDATDDAERAHFSHLLRLLEEGPHGGAAAAARTPEAPAQSAHGAVTPECRQAAGGSRPREQSNAGATGSAFPAASAAAAPGAAAGGSSGSSRSSTTIAPRGAAAGGAAPACALEARHPELKTFAEVRAAMESPAENPPGELPRGGAPRRSSSPPAASAAPMPTKQPVAMGPPGRLAASVLWSSGSGTLPPVDPPGRWAVVKEECPAGEDAIRESAAQAPPVDSAFSRQPTLRLDPVVLPDAARDGPGRTAHAPPDLAGAAAAGRSPAPAPASAPAPSGLPPPVDRVSEQSVQTLMDMGFDREVATQALRHCGSVVGDAVEWLLSRDL